MKWRFMQALMPAFPASTFLQSYTRRLDGRSTRQYENTRNDQDSASLEMRRVPSSHAHGQHHLCPSEEIGASNHFE